MSVPARYSIDRHVPNYRERFRTEYSDPHLAVMQALITAGIRVTGSEEWIQCEDCGQPGCHHQWKPDVPIADTNIIVEVHRIRNRKDIDDQVERKACLEHSGRIVIQVTDKDPPRLAVEKVQRTLALKSKQEPRMTENKPVCDFCGAVLYVYYSGDQWLRYCRTCHDFRPENDARLSHVEAPA